MNQLDTADQIIKVLDNIGEKFGIAFNGVKNDIVPYLQELGGKIVAHQIATSWFWIAIGMVFLLLTIYCLIGEAKGWGGSGGLLLLVGLVSLIIALGIIGTNVYCIIECYTFPEKVIMDYIQTFVATHNIK